MQTSELTGRSGAETVVADLAEIPLGEGRTFAVDGEQIAVFRHRSGKISAVQAVCPHAGGPLADGQIDEDVVICPLHLNAFDLATGRSSSLEERLTVHPCRVEGGRVLLGSTGGEAC